MEERLQQIKNLLDSKRRLYNQPSFIQGDPISIPHRFTQRQDIEIKRALCCRAGLGQPHQYHQQLQ